MFILVAVVFVLHFASGHRVSGRVDHGSRRTTSSRSNQLLTATQWQKTTRRNNVTPRMLAKMANCTSVIILQFFGQKCARSSVTGRTGRVERVVGLNKENKYTNYFRRSGERERDEDREIGKLGKRKANIERQKMCCLSCLKKMKKKLKKQKAVQQDNKTVVCALSAVADTQNETTLQNSQQQHKDVVSVVVQ